MCGRNVRDELRNLQRRYTEQIKKYHERPDRYWDNDPEDSLAFEELPDVVDINASWINLLARAQPRVASVFLQAVQKETELRVQETAMHHVLYTLGISDQSSWIYPAKSFAEVGIAGDLPWNSCWERLYVAPAM